MQEVADWRARETREGLLSYVSADAIPVATERACKTIKLVQDDKRGSSENDIDNWIPSSGTRTRWCADARYQYVIQATESISRVVRTFPRFTKMWDDARTTKANRDNDAVLGVVWKAFWKELEDWHESRSTLLLQCSWKRATAFMVDMPFEIVDRVEFELIWVAKKSGEKNIIEKRSWRAKKKGGERQKEENVLLMFEQHEKLVIVRQRIGF